MPDTGRTNLEAMAVRSMLDHARRLDVRRVPLATLLGALVLLLVATPLLQDLEGGKPIEAVLLTIVLVSAVLAVGARRRTLVLAIILVIPAVVTRWADHYRPDLLPPAVFVISGALFITFVIAHLMGFMLRAPRVNSEILCAGITTYLLIGLVWALAYLLAARLDPGAFAFTVGAPSGRTLDTFNGLYFSFVTLSTVGYGDIVPTSRVTRMLAIVEATTGMFYVTILISRLVALYSSKMPSRDTDPPSDG